MFILLLASLSSTQPPVQSLSTIPVGSVFGNDIGQVINGWQQRGGGLYPQRVTRGFTTTEEYACCYATFKKNSDFLITRTEAVARNTQGGVIAERVMGVRLAAARAGEVDASCQLLWLKPVISFYNARTRAVRSIIISGEEFVEFEWRDNGTFCDLGD